MQRAGRWMPPIFFRPCWGAKRSKPRPQFRRAGVRANSHTADPPRLFQPALRMWKPPPPSIPSRCCRPLKRPRRSPLAKRAGCRPVPRGPAAAARFSAPAAGAPLGTGVRQPGASALAQRLPRQVLCLTLSIRACSALASSALFSSSALAAAAFGIPLAPLVPPPAAANPKKVRIL